VAHSTFACQNRAPTEHPYQQPILRPTPARTQKSVVEERRRKNLAPWWWAPPRQGRGRSPRAAARGRARPSAAGRGRGSRACAGGRAPRTPGRGCGHRRARLELAGRGSRARRRGLCSAGREGELAAQAAQDAPAAPRRLALLCWPRARWPPPCARSRR